MYATRPLSLYRKSASALEIEPEEGPYSGFLVITDEEAEKEDTFCFGACKMKAVRKLPFPQDRFMTVVHSTEHNQETSLNRAWFVPVLDQPLSANRYYVIQAKGRRKGQACTSSREVYVEVRCFNTIKTEAKPKPFDHRDIYQQFKVHRQHRDTFFAKSLAADGIPPRFLRNKGWEPRVSRHFKANLADALGLDARLRARLPSFDFPVYNRRSKSVVVGQWYCPFIFVREELATQRKQMNKSIFYHMTLEQWWQEFYSCENVTQDEENDEDEDEDEDNMVNVSAVVRREVNLMLGFEATKEMKVGACGFLWYKGRSSDGRREGSVGLSLAIVEKMRWVQEEGGWFGGGENEVMVERAEEIRSETENKWRRFACYMLVESFALRRLNGALVLRSDFRHTHRIRSKWE